MSESRLPQLGDWTSFEELHALQDERLPEVLAHAARSPFYAQRFAGRHVGADDFAALDLTTKQDLNDSYPFGMLAVPAEELDSYYESSGTGGKPTPAYYTDADWQDLGERYARKTIAIRPSDVFFVRSPYALGLAAHLAHKAGRLCGATIVPGDNRSSVVPYARVVRVMHDLGVTLTWSNPTDCLLWAAAARRAGKEPGRDFPQLRGLFVGGEPLSPARRERISSIWGVPVIDEYGCTEIGSLAGRCSEDRLHLWADRVKAEVYDAATGTLSDEGIGELVLTPLYLRAMPLIRYNIHDWVEVSHDDCPCGWKLPMLTVRGRTGQGYPVADTRITQLQVEQVVYSLPAEHGVLFWRGRAEPDRLHVQIEVPPEVAGTAADALHAAVSDQLRVPCQVEALAPGALVPEDVLASPRQSLKPRALFGPGESWDQAVVFTAR
jgi:phenylacetate-CoA ligase